MSASAKLLIVVALLLTAIAVSCKSSGDKSRTAETNSNTSASSGKPDDQGLIYSGTGEAKEKPDAGRANVQGRVLYNGKPAANIEVKLCEKFNQYLNGCGGQMFTAKTGDDGQYLIRNVPPGIYEGLTANRRQQRRSKMGGLSRRRLLQIQHQRRQLERRPDQLRLHQQTR